MGIDKFFEAKSVAVIGASNKKGKVGYALAKHLQEFQGKKYWINKKRSTIFGDESVSSILEIKGKVDLAIIAIPAVFVKQVLEECGEKGIKNVIIISAGFGEAGNIEAQNELLTIADVYGIRILGPNNFGVVNTSTGLDCTFAKARPRKGKVGFISQSGALWSAIAEYSQRHNVGFSKFASLGDMADVDFNELINYLEKDKDTKVIMLYIETLRDGRKFIDIVKKCKKPVIVVKAGRTKAGAKAAHSHTGSLAGEYNVYRAAFKQAGAFFVENLSGALNLAKYLSMQKVPEGNNVVIVTNAGGPGILCADFLIEHGLEVVKLPKGIRFDLPKAWSHNNPIDVLGDADADRYKAVLDVLANKKFYDSLIVIFTPQQMADAGKIAQEIVKFSRKSKVPTVCGFLGYKGVEDAEIILEKNQIPCFFELERAAELLKYLKH